jgi:hypothetical protein
MQRVDARPQLQIEVLTMPQSRSPVTSTLRGQRAVYRKGLVGGLTLAEVCILIIFVLLLLVGYEHMSRKRLEEAQRQATTIDPRLKIKLEKDSETFQEAAKEMGVDPGTTPPDDFLKLVRALVAASRRDVINALIQNEDLRKQVEHYKNLAAGKAKGDPPCLMDQKGDVEYLYDVVLGSEGISLTEHASQARLAASDGYRLPKIDPGRVLAIRAFQSLTSELVRQSRDRHCRFYVLVNDGTADSEKSLYKSELAIVDSYFYYALGRQ